MRFDIQPDGSVLMREYCEVATEDGVIERHYDPPVQTRRVLRMMSASEAVEERFQTIGEGIIRWEPPAGTYAFVIESMLPEAVFPAIDIPAAREYWREALESPRTRFVFDYRFVTSGHAVQLQLYWPKGWSAVRTITPDTLAQPVEGGYRIRHLLDGQTLTPDPKKLIRPGAILLVPVVGLLLWILFAIREIVRRRSVVEPEVNEEFLRTKIYSEAPEVIAAQWKGVDIPPAIETFLRRLEKQRKVGLTIERTPKPDDEEDEDVKVTVRLLVPRSQLSAFDRAGIDVLIPSGMEISSDQIQEKYRNADFDPTDALAAALKQIAIDFSPGEDAWYSKLFSFLVFWPGVILLATHFHSPAAVTAAIMVIILGIVWPANVVRSLRFGYLMPLIVVLLTTIVNTAINLLREPLHPYTALGFAFIMIAVVKTCMSQSTGRESREVLERRAELAAARKWFRSNPLVRDDADPWLEALGLPRRGAPSKLDEETWGWALMTMNEE